MDRTIFFILGISGGQLLVTEIKYTTSLRAVCMLFTCAIKDSHEFLWHTITSILSEITFVNKTFFSQTAGLERFRRSQHSLSKM